MSKDFIQRFLDEEHPTMLVSHDGKIGQVSGVSFVRVHVYVKENPRWFPARLWYWLAEKFTHSVSETTNH
jgi:hypothetical protein